MAENHGRVQKFDALVIGTGQGGKPLARDLARAGHRTAIVEREHVGGTCINVGCTPTKTMVASAKVAYLTGRAEEYGVVADDPRVDLGQVRARKRRIVERFRTGSRRSLEDTEGIELVFGEARFSGPKEMEVHTREGTTRRLAADRIFINVGCRPAVPPIEGLDEVDYLDSTSIMELETVPRHLLVIGGGYIGVEFGQMFRRFGSEVTLVQRGSQLLSREDEDVAETVTEILRDDGVRVLLDSEAARVEQGEDGTVNLTVRGPEGEGPVSGSHLLVAVGRRPNSDLLNLEAAGVETDERGYIRVDGGLATSAPEIYALGDVKGGPAFTHISYDDYRVLKTNLLDGGDATTEGRLVPYVVFMDPELGRVGLTESRARAAGHQVRVAKMPMEGVARALERDETRGFMKVVVDADSGRILGCAILGIEGGELMSMVEIAMMAELPYTALRDAIFAHPTLAEAFNNLFAGLD